MYVEVGIDGLNSFYTYKMDYEPNVIGNKVLVPLGRGNKVRTGYIINVIDSIDIDDSKVKKVVESQPYFTKQQMELGKWISEKYFCTLAKALKLMEMKGENIKRPKKLDLIDEHLQFDSNKTCTKSQQIALDTINNELTKEKKKPILLHGVTGSGKTEVYLQAIEKVLKEGKQCIMLVPEISLTPQIVEIFLKRFKDKVAVTHSRLSKGQRATQYKNAKNGTVSIMVGARSALFAPFDNIGIIIIDEEHENTYKSESTPKYDSIAVAEKICKQFNALLILGSATPNIKSYYKAKEGYYNLVEMSERVNKNLPENIVVDMREEFAKGNRSIFSEILLEKIEKALSNNKQVILFLNRRGFSNFVSCRYCGEVIGCNSCNVNYTYHKNINKLICHYCNTKVENPKVCPTCGSKYIKHFGLGTQKIEEEIEKVFPMAKVIRMDNDTTTKKNSHEKLLTKFKNKEANILIGTQMIAKGLDFPDVTVVGVISADLTLNAGNYLSSETTFSLISQVSGRAGRSDHKGEVIIQTYNPNHYTIAFAKDHNYKGFYEQEISLRRQMNYPPFSNIFIIVFTCEDQKRIMNLLNTLSSIMTHYNRKKLFDILGPSPCVISKINNKYRWKIITKGEDEKLLTMFNQVTLEKLKKLDTLSGIDISMDINPYNI